MRTSTKQSAFARLTFKTNEPGPSYFEIYKVKSMSVASSCATKLLKNAQVQALIQELQQKAEDAAIMDKQEILKTLSVIGRAKLTDFMTAGADGSWVDIGPENESAGALQEITSRTEYDKDSSSAAVITKIKLLSPIQATQEISKLRDFYPKDGTGEGGGTYNDNRELHIHVQDKEAQDEVEKIVEGKRLET